MALASQSEPQQQQRRSRGLLAKSAMAAPPAGALILASSRAMAFTSASPSARSAQQQQHALRGAGPLVEAQSPSASASGVKGCGASAAAASALLAGSGLLAARSCKRASAKSAKPKVVRQAVPSEVSEVGRSFEEWMRTGGLEQLQSMAQSDFAGFSRAVGEFVEANRHSFGLVEPAYADVPPDAASAVAAATTAAAALKPVVAASVASAAAFVPDGAVPWALPEVAAATAPAAASTATTAAAALKPVVLDPNVKYLYGTNGNVLLDPMSRAPLVDDWWNGFVGIQSNFIKDIDGALRGIGVPQAFGWSIVLYTLLIKTVFYPLQQSQLKSTSMMQLLQPKVKEVQEKYKDDPETLQRVLGQLYTVMDVNPLGGCLPTLLTLPIYWSLYGVWRRLSSEGYKNYNESWLWVPNLGLPNPDFQFKLDWLFEGKQPGGWGPGFEPAAGWPDYVSYLVFPAILVGTTVIQQQQAVAAKPPAEDGKEEDQNLVLKVLPWVSVYFIGALSLELPQAVSVYYASNTFMTLAQTALVKNDIRKEIPGYEEFEKTGKFPEGAFEEMAKSNAPPPATLHEAAVKGDLKTMKSFIEATGSDAVDINSWDDKQIAPLGYAVACGHREAVKLLVENGADLNRKDGQDNTFLHYAAGYGHDGVLEDLFELGGKTVWTDDVWPELRNKKGQTPLDAARVNRKGKVVDIMNAKLGLEPEVQEAEVIQTATGTGKPAATSEVVEATPVSSSAPATSEETEKGRAALMAAMQGAAASGSAAPAAAAGGSEAALADALQSAAGGKVPEAGSAQAGQTAEAMRQAVEKLRANPEAVAQAKEMMSKMPPGMLSMMTGGKMSEEQAKKAMGAMEGMSTEDLLAKADVAAETLQGPGGAAAPAASKPAPEPVTVDAVEAAAPRARAVD